MNKQDLVRSATERLGLSRKDAVELVDGLFDDIQAAVVSGERSKFPALGSSKSETAQHAWHEIQRPANK